MNTKCEWIVSIISLIMIIIILEVDIAYAKTVRYPNTYAKDFMADAPWRVKDTSTEIPIGFFIKDSDVNDLPDLNSVEIYHRKKNGTWERIYYHSFGGMYLSQEFWEWVATKFENAENALLNGKSITAGNLGYQAGDTIDLIAYIKGADDWWQGGSFTFSRRLRISVETPFPRPDADWLYGDAHYHTIYTRNPYEYGGGLNTTKLAIKAIDLDWVTTTEHASDYSDWDLNQSLWQDFKTQIEKQNNLSGLPFIIGEEISCQPVTGTVKDGIHLLVHNNSQFISGSVNLLNDAMLSLESRLKEVEKNPYAIAFAAHPSDMTDIIGVGDICEWSDINFQTALKYPFFYGLEVWNTRKTMSSPGGNLDDIDPFTGSNGGWVTKYDETNRESHFLPNLEKSIEKWTNLMEKHLNPIRKIVITAGSDAHGDMNYFSYMKFNLERLGTNDNALGKVRTLVYAPDHSKLSVLDGLKNGHSIVTDGPVLLIGFDMNNDWELRKKDGDFIVGDVIHIPKVEHIQITIKWISYNKIPIKSVKLFLKKEMIHEFSPENDMSILGDARRGSKKVDIYGKFQTNGYLRAECISESFIDNSGYTDRYRAYTNPIWFDTSEIIKGDVDNNQIIDLQDAIISLQIISGMKPSDLVNKISDCNGDNKVGIEETVYVLQHLSMNRVK